MFFDMMKLQKVGLLIVLFLPIQLSYSQTVTVHSIDAREWPIDKSPFAVAGSCYFFEGQLLDPEECQKASGEILNFPELWKLNEGLGFATYSLMVLLPHDRPENM